MVLYKKLWQTSKILYVQRRRFRSHSHRPRDQSVATEQPLVSRKKFVFSNWLLVGGEAVGCRWVKLVTKTYTVLHLKSPCNCFSHKQIAFVVCSLHAVSQQSPTTCRAENKLCEL